MSDVMWDQGLVRFVITDSSGRESQQEQMCWHRGKFIERMMGDAALSQLDPDKDRRFKFKLAQS